METLLGAAATTFGLLQTIYRAALLSSSGSMQHYRQAHIQSPIIVELRIKAALIVQLLSGSSSDLNAQLSSSELPTPQKARKNYKWSAVFQFNIALPAVCLPAPILVVVMLLVENHSQYDLLSGPGSF